LPTASLRPAHHRPWASPGHAPLGPTRPPQQPSHHAAGSPCASALHAEPIACKATQSRRRTALQSRDPPRARTTSVAERPTATCFHLLLRNPRHSPSRASASQAAGGWLLLAAAAAAAVAIRALARHLSQSLALRPPLVRGWAWAWRLPTWCTCPMQTVTCRSEECVDSPSRVGSRRGIASGTRFA